MGHSMKCFPLFQTASTESRHLQKLKSYSSVVSHPVGYMLDCSLSLIVRVRAVHPEILVSSGMVVRCFLWYWDWSGGQAGAMP